MDTRPEVKADELERVCQQFNSNVSVRKVSAQYFAPMQIGWRPPSYSKIVVQVVGQHVEDIRACICRIFLLYGKPDEVPSAFFGGKRVGRTIIEELTRELRGGKR